MLNRLEELANLRVDFALETTLSGCWLAKKILEWKRIGYSVHLYYVGLASPELAVIRVSHRVRKGGHHIPAEVVHRRFYRSLRLLEKTYKDLVDVWIVYDNSGGEPVLIQHSGGTP